jgi:hypothetical protein
MLDRVRRRRERNVSSHAKSPTSIRSIIDAVEVDDKAIRMIGSKDMLQTAIAANRSRTEMFVVLANGAPFRIEQRTLM